MATKKKRKVTKKSVKRTPSKDVSAKEYLQILLRYTERAISGDGSGVDSFFSNQAEKLKLQLSKV